MGRTLKPSKGRCKHSSSSWQRLKMGFFEARWLLPEQLTQDKLLLLSHFSRVRLCVTPWTAAHQAPPSLGFSRQEHWSGLPFPSPMHASEKWKWRRSVVSNPQRPRGQQPSRLLHPWGFPGKSTGVGCHCLLRFCAKHFIYFSLVILSHNPLSYSENTKQHVSGMEEMKVRYSG